MSVYTRTIAANMGASYVGLAAGMGYTVLGSDGATKIARIGTGITEGGGGAGAYSANVATWDSAWISGLYYFDITGYDDIWLDTFQEVLTSFNPFTRTIAVFLGSGHSGLVGSIAYTVVASDNTGLIARTTAGFLEIGDNGAYYANVPDWDPTWRGKIIYDDGGSIYLEEPFEPVDVVIVPPVYTSIYAWIRSRLRDSVGSVQNSEFDREIESVIRRTLSPYELDYAEVTNEQDLENLNEAIGLTVASRMLIPYTTGGGNASLLSEAVSSPDESASRSFSPAGLNGGEKALWIMEARSAFAQISFVKLRSGANNARFAVDGRRRERCNNYGVRPYCD